MKSGNLRNGFRTTKQVADLSLSPISMYSLSVRHLDGAAQHNFKSMFLSSARSSSSKCLTMKRSERQATATAIILRMTMRLRMAGPGKEEEGLLQSQVDDTVIASLGAPPRAQSQHQFPIASLYTVRSLYV